MTASSREGFTLRRSASDKGVYVPVSVHLIHPLCINISLYRTLGGASHPPAPSLPKVSPIPREPLPMQSCTCPLSFFHCQPSSSIPLFSTGSECGRMRGRRASRGRYGHCLQDATTPLLGEARPSDGDGDYRGPDSSQLFKPHVPVPHDLLAWTAPFSAC